MISGGVPSHRHVQAELYFILTRGECRQGRIAAATRFSTLRRCAIFWACVVAETGDPKPSMSLSKTVSCNSAFVWLSSCRVTRL